MSGIDETHRRAVWALPALLALVLLVSMAGPALHAAWAQGAAVAPQHQGGGEANLKIPDLAQVSFGGTNGRTPSVLEAPARKHLASASMGAPTGPHPCSFSRRSIRTPRPLIRFRRNRWPRS